VSTEVLDTAEIESTASNSEDERPAESPPAKIVASVGEPEESTFQQLFEEKQEEVKNRAQDLLDRVVRSASGKQTRSGGAAKLPTAIGAIEPITVKQSARGDAGEEEIKRRLRLPTGWEGFVFVRDTRKDGCGFDFEAKYSNRLVKLEVKTFTLDGRVIVTSRELQAAAEHRSDYYLIGVLDDRSQSRAHWKTFLMRDPILSLISMGNFVLDTKLQIDASELFDFGSVAPETETDSNVLDSTQTVEE